MILKWNFTKKIPAQNLEDVRGVIMIPYFIVN
jgi:hypothetical protein